MSQLEEILAAIQEPEYWSPTWRPYDESRAANQRVRLILRAAREQRLAEKQRMDREEHERAEKATPVRRGPGRPRKT